MLFNNNGLVVASERSGTNPLQLLEQIQKAGNETFHTLGFDGLFDGDIRYCSDFSEVSRAFLDNDDARVIVIITDGLRDTVPSVEALSIFIERARKKGAHVFLFGKEELGELCLPYLASPREE